MAELAQTFRDIVGDANVLTREMDTAYYRSGFRYGFGGATAVVFRGHEWSILDSKGERKPSRRCANV